MVFIDRTIVVGVTTGLLITRDTGKYVALLIVEAIFGLIVALSNILVIFVLIRGRKTLIKSTIASHRTSLHRKQLSSVYENHFYVIVSNVIVLTSMKGLIELGFILPYYIMQAFEPTNNEYTLFSKQYDSLIFNLSVLADYGILFFSVLIAINRYFAVTFSAKMREIRSSSLRTTISCAITWACAVLIPILFFLCECEYEYNYDNKLYYNRCEKSSPLITTIITVLVYLSYACTCFVMILYMIIFIFLERQKRKLSLSEGAIESSNSTVQMKLLRQSIVVFILYACSIASVFILSFVDATSFGFFDLAYLENLLNLSISAAYSICFLVMSGDMRSVITALIAPSISSKVESITVSSKIDQ